MRTAKHARAVHGQLTGLRAVNIALAEEINVQRAINTERRSLLGAELVQKALSPKPAKLTTVAASANTALITTTPGCDDNRKKERREASKKAERRAARRTPSFDKYLSTQRHYETGAPVWQEPVSTADMKSLGAVVTPHVRTVCELDAQGRPVLTAALAAAAAAGRRGRLEDLSDERFLKRHQPHVVAERRYKKWGGQSTRFERDMALRLERIQAREAKAAVGKKVTSAAAAAAAAASKRGSSSKYSRGGGGSRRRPSSTVVSTVSDEGANAGVCFGVGDASRGLYYSDGFLNGVGGGRGLLRIIDKHVISLNVRC